MAATTNATVSALQFAKLSPLSDKARRMVSDAVDHMRTLSDEVHLKFFVPDKSNLNSVIELEDSSDFDSEPQEEKRQILNTGFYQLSLDKKLLPVVSRFGWSVGRSSSRSQHVDILLSKPKDPRARTIGPIHCSFTHHPQSGAFLLASRSQKLPLSYMENGIWRMLPFGSKRVISEKTTRIRFGDSEFELSHTLTEADREIYFTNLLELLRLYNEDARPIQFLPGDSGMTVFHDQNILRTGNTIGYGGFGWVDVGVILDSGEPIAIKELHVRRKHERAEICEEFGVAKLVQGHYGLIGAYDLWCEHKTPAAQCSRLPDRLFMSLPLAPGTFASMKWDAIPLGTQLKLFQDSLKGVQTLHNLGYMHRDISSKNILVLSANPNQPKAALTDFGKAVPIGPRYKETTIGPLYICAPEVFSHDGYTESVDLWAWAISVALSIKIYDTFVTINRNNLTDLCAKLRRARRRRPQYAQLVGLLLDVFIWNAEERVTVEEALQHPCWHEMTSDDTYSTSNKRKRSEEEENGEDTPPEGSPTQPFSRT